MRELRRTCLVASLAFGLAASAAAACSSGAIVAVPDLDASTDATTGGEGGPSPGGREAGGPGEDAGAPFDAAADDAEAPDDAARTADAAVTCGAQTCRSDQVCCAVVRDGGPSYACQASCSDGGVTIACDGPEDCANPGSACCATLSVGAGRPPLCPLRAAEAKCKVACATTIPTGCPGSGQVRLCKRAADCAGEPQGNTQCCRFQQGGGEATFCTNATLAPFATCLP